MSFLNLVQLVYSHVCDAGVFWRALSFQDPPDLHLPIRVPDQRKDISKRTQEASLGGIPLAHLWLMVSHYMRSLKNILQSALLIL